MFLPPASKEPFGIDRQLMDLRYLVLTDVSQDGESPPRAEVIARQSFAREGYPITSITFPDGASLVLIGNLRISLGGAEA